MDHNTNRENDSLVDLKNINNDIARKRIVQESLLLASEASVAIDKFSLWLLALSGASATLMITQINSIMPFLSQVGFKVSMFFLLGSSVFGILSKAFGVSAEIQMQILKSINITLPPILDELDKQQEQVEEFAKQRGVKVEKSFDFNKTIEDIYAPFPFYIKWFIVGKKWFSFGKSKPQIDPQYIAYYDMIRPRFRQSLFSSIQFVFFMGFVGSATMYASLV